MYADKRLTYTIGDVSITEASQWKSRTENLLMRLRQNMLQIPRGVSVTDFILHDGRPPLDQDLASRKETTLHELREGYVETFANGAIEKNTLYTAGIHLDHVETTLGKRFILSGLTLAKLQKHIDRRAKDDVAPVTIKKEIDTFRSAWNWGRRMRWVDQPFPSAGLVYSKIDEKLPFMTWQEIKRRIQAGAHADQLWECLFLTDAEVAELLTYVKKKTAPAWVYPAVVMAARGCIAPAGARGLSKSRRSSDITSLATAPPRNPDRFVHRDGSSAVVLEASLMSPDKFFWSSMASF